LDSAAGKSIFGVKPKLFSIGLDVLRTLDLNCLFKDLVRFRGLGLISFLRIGLNFSVGFVESFQGFGSVSQFWFAFLGLIYFLKKKKLIDTGFSWFFRIWINS
jgi:hypothetical protein